MEKMDKVKENVQERLGRAAERLPMKGDLPRLWRRMRVVRLEPLSARSREEEAAQPKDKRSAWKQKESTSTYLLSSSSASLREAAEAVATKRHPTDVFDGPKREATDRSALFDLLEAVARETQGLKEAEQVAQYRAAVADDPAELSLLLGELFKQLMADGTEPPVVTLLKSCNQAAIAPVITDIKSSLLMASPEFVTVDVDNTWWITLLVDGPRVSVQNIKGERNMNKLFYFDWMLSVHYELQDQAPPAVVDIAVSVHGLVFHPLCPRTTRLHVAQALACYLGSPQDLEPLLDAEWVDAPPLPPPPSPSVESRLTDSPNKKLRRSLESDSDSSSDEDGLPSSPPSSSPGLAVRPSRGNPLFQYCALL